MIILFIDYIDYVIYIINFVYRKKYLTPLVAPLNFEIYLLRWWRVLRVRREPPRLRRLMRRLLREPAPPRIGPLRLSYKYVLPPVDTTVGCVKFGEKLGDGVMGLKIDIYIIRSYNVCNGTHFLNL
jgi:hypothetical protein